MNNKTITLNNNNIQLTILPNIGGRVVSLICNGSRNILSSDSSLWNHNFKKAIEEYTSFEILQFRGHSTWVGPQSEWWVRQNINQEKKKNKDTWPPDPFLDYGDFEILKQTNNSIELLGGKSKYTGVQIQKFYKILDSGKVELKARATNIRKEEISWDIWFNTRFPGNCKSYVPIAHVDDYRVETSPENEELNSKVVDGLFTFIIEEPSANFSQKSAKAFLTPNQPYIFSFNENYMFVVHIDISNAENIHSEHAVVEIYNAISENSTDSLLELEYHSPYKKMKPGDSVEISEIWELIEYDGNDSETEHINFINEWMNRIP